MTIHASLLYKHVRVQNQESIFFEFQVGYTMKYERCGSDKRVDEDDYLLEGARDHKFTNHNLPFPKLGKTNCPVRTCQQQ